MAIAWRTCGSTVSCRKIMGFAVAQLPVWLIRIAAAVVFAGLAVLTVIGGRQVSS